MIRCPNCNREQPYSVITCDCGFNLESYAKKLQAEQRVRDAAERPYQFLPTLPIILHLLGLLSVIAGLVYTISLIVEGDATWLRIGLALFGGILAGIPYFTLSTMLTLQLDMNQRQEQIRSILQRIEKGITESTKI